MQHLVRPGISGLGNSGQRNSARADVRAADGGNSDSGSERRVRDTRRHIPGARGHRLVTVDAIEGRDDRQRIPATQGLSTPRVRVVGDAVAAPDDRRVVQVIGEPEARSEELLAESHTVVLRNAPSSPDQRLVGLGIVRFDAQTILTRPVGVELPSQSQIEGQLAAPPPAIADVERVLIFEARHPDELAALARSTSGCRGETRRGHSSRSRRTAFRPGTRPWHRIPRG